MSKNQINMSKQLLQVEVLSPLPELLITIFFYKKGSCLDYKLNQERVKTEFSFYRIVWSILLNHCSMQMTTLLYFKQIVLQIMYQVTFSSSYCKVNISFKMLFYNITEL